MVLENATESSDSFASSEPPPSSDRDTYSDSNSPFETSYPSPNSVKMRFDTPSANPNSPQSSEVTIDLSKLPTRFSLLGSRPHPPALYQGIADQCRFASNLLERHLRQEEVDAFAFHYAKSMRMGSLGEPVGLTFGLAQAYRTRHTYRFPLWSPFPKEGGGRLSPDKFLMLRGEMARATWHFLRTSLYAAGGITIGGIFFGSYALSTALAGRAMDPRLKECNDAMKAKIQEVGKENARAVARGEAPAAGRGGVTANIPAGQETYEMARQRRGVREIQARDEDDMSPSGGYNMQEAAKEIGHRETVGTGGHSMDTEVMSDSQSRMRDVAQRPRARDSPATNNEDTFDMNRAASHPSQNGSQQPQSANKPTSSWARIRADAASQAQQGNNEGSPRQGTTPSSRGSWKPPQSEQRQGSTVGDAFSFSETDEEKQLARGEAQRDFDRRIEREREGKDFEEAGQGKRWR